MDPKLALAETPLAPAAVPGAPLPPGLPSSAPFTLPPDGAPPAPPAPESGPMPLEPTCPLLDVPAPPLPPENSPGSLPPAPPSTVSAHGLVPGAPELPLTPAGPAIPGDPAGPAAPAPAMMLSSEMTTLSLLSRRMPIELVPGTVAVALRMVSPSSVTASAIRPVTAVVPPSTTVALSATSRRKAVEVNPPYTLTLGRRVRLPA